MSKILKNLQNYYNIADSTAKDDESVMTTYNDLVVEYIESLVKTAISTHIEDANDNTEIIDNYWDMLNDDGVNIKQQPITVSVPISVIINANKWIPFCKISGNDEYKLCMWRTDEIVSLTMDQYNELGL